MPLGAWIFVSVVLLLVVLNKPFRKFFLWTVAVATLCCGLFFGYIAIRDWRERETAAREAAILQKRQDSCNARLNAAGSSSDHMTNAFERLATADLCRANPDITIEEAIAAQHPTLDFSKAQPIVVGSQLPPEYTLKQPARKSVRPKTIEGTITNDAVLYSESSSGGPGGQVLGKVERGTHVRIIRLDSILGNVQVKAPNGVTGWISADDVRY